MWISLDSSLIALLSILSTKAITSDSTSKGTLACFFLTCSIFWFLDFAGAPCSNLATKPEI